MADHHGGTGAAGGGILDKKSFQLFSNFVVQIDNNFIKFSLLKEASSDYDRGRKSYPDVRKILSHDGWMDACESYVLIWPGVMERMDGVHDWSHPPPMPRI